MKTHLHIISGSLKRKEWGEIIIDGKTGLPNIATRRGINLLVLNKELKPAYFRFYDFNNYDVNETFVNDINQITDSSILILCVKGDGCKRLNEDTRKFIYSKLKSKYIMQLERNQAWCYVVKKFDNLFRNVIEKLDPIMATINNFYDLSLTFRPVLMDLNYYYDAEMMNNSPIKMKTYYLKKQLNNIPKYDMSSRLRLLHNEYEGATCYIISCGPSVNNYNTDLIKRLAGHNLVLCIKQAYTKFIDITDFHLFNFCNLANYDYSENPNVITAYMAQDDKVRGNYDLNFALLKEYQINKIRSKDEKFPPLSKRMNFEHFTMDKVVNRPEGPGIMYELGIYMALHLGAKEIVTIGWDVNYKSPKKIDTPHGQVTDSVTKSHFYGTNKHTQKNIQKIVNENEFIISSSKILNLWLKLHGVELYLMSELSKLDKSIPRIDAKKIYNYITSKEPKLTNIMNPIRRTDNIDFINYCHIDSYKSIFNYIKAGESQEIKPDDENEQSLKTYSDEYVYEIDRVVDKNGKFELEEVVPPIDKSKMVKTDRFKPKQNSSELQH